MSLNWSGLDSRPSVCTAISNAARRRRRRLVDGAGGNLHVGGAQGRDHVAGGQAARLHLGGVEPDPHGIVARAEHDRVADAVDTGEDILDVDGRVIGNVLLVERAVGRDQMDHQHQVGRLLAHGHAEALHLLRQPRQRDRHAVLHQHLRLIDVRSRLEHDLDRERAVAGRLRHHVEHVVDAVDLLLDRRGDRLGDDLGRGARIGRRHADGRRRDLGKFGDRQRAKGNRANQRQDDRDDAREDRPVDEEMRKSHGGCLVILRLIWHAMSGSALLSGGLDLAVLGRDFLPGRARCRPSMTMRSVAASPERMTRKPSTMGPSSTSLVPTVPSSATVNTILRD